jgi:hypothetical protein
VKLNKIITTNQFFYFKRKQRRGKKNGKIFLPHKTMLLVSPNFSTLTYKTQKRKARQTLNNIKKRAQ